MCVRAWHVQHLGYCGGDVFKQLRLRCAMQELHKRYQTVAPRQLLLRRTRIKSTSTHSSINLPISLYTSQAYTTSSTGSLARAGQHARGT
jgi:hypothetical protein